MDDKFEYFLEEMGPALDSREVPKNSMERYRGKLPDQLLSYWEEHGWSGYGDGLFWTVNPEEYEPALQVWIGETQFMEHDAYHVIARTAFGGLFLWGEKTGNSLEIFAPGSFCIPEIEPNATRYPLDFEVQMFFANKTRKGCDFDGMFTGALKKLGRLEHDEMYGFVPAIALGGPGTLKTLQKVKAVEHLVLLAQLEPLDVITTPPF